MKHIIPLLIITFLVMETEAQKTLARIEVEISNPSELAFPLKTGLNTITTLPDSILRLVEVSGKKRIWIPIQIEHQDSQRQLYWIIKPDRALKKRIFELVTSKGPAPANLVKASKNNGALIINSNSKNLLQYNYKTVYPPSGVDSVFKRSAFIHPLWSPQGQVLTRIQPPDHYHHYGVWNPWTHVLFEGDTLDFWNLNKKQGTVRFAEFKEIVEGNVYAEYKALHEHVAYKNHTEEVILNEVQSVRIYQPHNDDYYIADITIQMHCATASPVTLLEYRYAGLGWRTTEQWTKDNSEVLTSEGKTRKDADGSKARWCLVQGLTDGVNAGVLIMSSPSNYNHPEPLRIWPENQYNRGDMFANFNPTKDRDWLLEPGKHYELTYRLVVFNGRFTNEKSEQAWKHFVTPHTISVKKL